MDNQEVNNRIVVSNKFDILEDCKEETLDNKSIGKNST